MRCYLCLSTDCNTIHENKSSAGSKPFTEYEIATSLSGHADLPISHTSQNSLPQFPEKAHCDSLKF